MKWVAPDYYRSFRCIASDCRHSCCIGWEIDIDEDTLEMYRGMGGEFGRRLRDGIAFSDEQASFRLREDERCPFLNERGLCDIILNLGEDALSQICTDHPRFRNFFEDREEIGLGLCCEAAARLILGSMEQAKLIVLEDDGEQEQLPDFEEQILKFREELFGIAQDRTKSIRERMDRILDASNIQLPEISFADWCEFYRRLEQLDPAWGSLLDRCGSANEWKNCADETAMEQLLVYFLYRHVAGAADEVDLAARAAFSVHAVQMIGDLFSVVHSEYSLDEFAETARMYSSEIEYSDENLQAILDRLMAG